jgi:hypothetical protein
MKNKFPGTRDLWDQVDKETPMASANWRCMTTDEKTSLMARCLTECNLEGMLKPSVCGEDGMVYFIQVASIPVNDRTDILIDFEEYLKEKVDEALTVWIEPQADKNSLRKFRGVKVSSL